MSGSVFPVGHRTSVGCTIPILRQASPLRASLPLKTPFRSMLLTVRGVPHCLTPRAHRVPCLPEGVATILTCRLHGAPERYSRWTERREQQGTQSTPKHRRSPLYSTRDTTWFVQTAGLTSTAASPMPNVIVLPDSPEPATDSSSPPVAPAPPPHTTAPAPR